MFRLARFQLFILSMFYENRLAITIFDNTVITIPSSVRLVENCLMDDKISNSVIEIDKVGIKIMKSIMKYDRLDFFTLIEEYKQIFPTIGEKN